MNKVKLLRTIQVAITDKCCINCEDFKYVGDRCVSKNGNECVVDTIKHIIMSYEK